MKIVLRERKVPWGQRHAMRVALSTDCILNVIYFGSNGFRKTPLGFSFVRVQILRLCNVVGRGKMGSWVVGRYKGG